MTSETSTQPRALNRDTRPRKSLSMPRETIDRASRDGRPAHPTHLAPGPPRETFALAAPCRKTPYERRKTRTPRPGGQGVHSEPFGAPVSRAPLEVVRAEHASNRKLGFGSRGGLDDPSGDAQNSDFGSYGVSGHADVPTAHAPPHERRQQRRGALISERAGQKSLGWTCSARPCHRGRLTA